MEGIVIKAYQAGLSYSLSCSKIWQILPRKCKAFLYSACNSRIQASNHTTLCEIILSQKKQKPFRRVQELQTRWTNIKETVPRYFVLCYPWDVHILQQGKKQINCIADFWLFFLCMLKTEYGRVKQHLYSQGD